MKTPLDTEVGLSLGDIVLDGDPAPPLHRGTAPQFLAHICCGQMAGWIKITLDLEVYGRVKNIAKHMIWGLGKTVSCATRAQQ